MIDLASSRQRVEFILRQLMPYAPMATDANGNWVFPIGSAILLVNVAQGAPAWPPIVVVAAPILAQVPKSPPLLDALNDLNARGSFARLYWLNGLVIAQTELVAATVDPPELSVAMSQVASVADAVDEHLLQQFGGVLPAAAAQVPSTPVGPQPTTAADQSRSSRLFDSVLQSNHESFMESMRQLNQP